MSSNILIIGPTGNVGSELVNLLDAAGISFRALVRSLEKAKGLPALAEPVLGDLARPETLTQAFQGVERAFILSPPIQTTETLERNAFDAAMKAGVKRIVYLSNYGAAEGDHDAHFHVHGKHENLVASMGVEWTVLRPTRFMNFTPMVWPSVFQSGVLIEGGGEGAITVIDPSDVAAVAFKALMEEGHAGRRYDLTSGDSFTAAQLAQMLSKHLDREITLFQGDTNALRRALVENGAPPEYASIMTSAFDRIATGFFHRTRTAEQLLGRKPRGYEEWLTQHLPGMMKALGVTA
ncbi:MAG: NmrA family protein [Fibrobacteria bacterium]|jgi:uncharacterized protein YbjT (DUF2867 family)|nr:NmrA family protein [Fibrobacteria bacterium]